jgi:hypothetical protein
MSAAVAADVRKHTKSTVAVAIEAIVVAIDKRTEIASILFIFVWLLLSESSSLEFRFRVPPDEGLLVLWPTLGH